MEPWYIKVPSTRCPNIEITTDNTLLCGMFVAETNECNFENCPRKFNKKGYC